MQHFTLADQVRCVQREIAQRRKVYPRLVMSGKMSREAMQREIATMEAVLKSLVEINGETLPDDLFAPPKGVRWA